MVCVRKGEVNFLPKKARRQADCEVRLGQPVVGPDKQDSIKSDQR